MTISSARPESNPSVVSRRGGVQVQNTTPVLTPTGWLSAADIRVGEVVLGPRGERIPIRGRGDATGSPLYLAEMSDGSSAVVGPAHVWRIQSHNDRERGKRDGRERWRPVDTIDVQSLLARSRVRDTYIPIVKTIQFDSPPSLMLDPYGLGLLLGDGCFRLGTPTFTKPELQLHRALAEAFPGNSQTHLGPTRKGTISLPSVSGPNVLSAGLRELGLWGEGSWSKFIPDQYLRALPVQRLALLQGLLDTDGWVQRNIVGNTGSYLGTSSGRLAGGVVEVVESLGGTTTVLHRARPRYQGGVGRPAWIVRVRLPRPLEPFRLERKLTIWRAGMSGKETPPVRRIISMKYVGVGNVVTIDVDTAHGLVLGRFVVT